MSQCISHASQRYKEKAPKAIVPEAFNTNLTFLGFRATNERKISPVKHQSKFGFISENAPKNLHFPQKIKKSRNVKETECLMFG